MVGARIVLLSATGTLANVNPRKSVARRPAHQVRLLPNRGLRFPRHRTKSGRRHRQKAPKWKRPASRGKKTRPRPEYLLRSDDLEWCRFGLELIYGAAQAVVFDHDLMRPGVPWRAHNDVMAPLRLSRSFIGLS